MRRIACIDKEELDETNRNRFVGARSTDPVPGTLKVMIADRLIRETNPDVSPSPHPVSLLSKVAFEEIISADWVFGCFDHDGPRAVLNELCVAYDRPLIDLASDVPEPGVYGGRVCVVTEAAGCLHCRSLLDPKDVRQYFESAEQQAEEDAIYGVDLSSLDQKGPSVAPINGVVAGLAATEFMVAVTGMRKPRALQEYRAHQSKVTVSTDAPLSECPICALRGAREIADVERYLRGRQ